MGVTRQLGSNHHAILLLPRFRHIAITLVADFFGRSQMHSSQSQRPRQWIKQDWATAEPTSCAVSSETFVALTLMHRVAYKRLPWTLGAFDRNCLR